MWSFRGEICTQSKSTLEKFEEAVYCLKKVWIGEGCQFSGIFYLGAFLLILEKSSGEGRPFSFSEICFGRVATKCNKAALLVFFYSTIQMKYWYYSGQQSGAPRLSWPTHTLQAFG